MNTPERIEARRGFKYYSPESAYIHKYYLAKEFYKAVTRQDIYAIIRFAPWGRNMPDQMINEGAIISYKDIGCEKHLTPQQMKAIDNAVKAYDADRLATLTDEEINAAIAMNERLTRLEEDVKNECLRIEDGLIARIERGDKFLTDYEIDIDIDFYMDDQDPEYYEDDVYHDTEIMTSLNKHVKRLPNEIQKEDYWGIGDREDHNDRMKELNVTHPLWGIRHCYLFHELYDHSPMPLKHLARISDIFTDIKVYYQNSFSFTDALQAHIKRGRK